MGVVISGSTGIDAGSLPVNNCGNTEVEGNLNLSGVGTRITGDFSNATASNRVAFQTSVTNGNTIVSARPNGNGTQGMFMCESSQDADNCQTMNIQATSTDTKVVSAIRGTAAYVPMSFLTGGSERMRIDTAGNVGIGTTTINNKLEVNGSIGFGSTTGNGRIFSDANWGCLLQSDVSSPAAAEFGFINNAGSTLAVIDTSGNLLLRSGNGGIGYGTGAGGTVTQLTSKSTAVTLNKPSGKITMNNASLAAGESVVFGVNNSLITSSDIINVNMNAGANGDKYDLYVWYVAAGIFYLRLKNIHAISLADALVINFAIIKGAVA